jgi:hypothetical protein
MSPGTDSVYLCRKQPNMRQAAPETACLCKRMLASKVGESLAEWKYLTSPPIISPSICRDLHRANSMQLRSRCFDTYARPRSCVEEEGTHTWRSRNVGRTPACQLAFQFARLAQSSCSGREYPRQAQARYSINSKLQPSTSHKSGLRRNDTQGLIGNERLRKETGEL